MAENNSWREILDYFSAATQVGLIDGDTIDVLTEDKTTMRIRLNGIDVPETGQPFGKNAKQYLSEKIGGKGVTIVPHDKDRYGRTIETSFVRMLQDQALSHVQSCPRGISNVDWSNVDWRGTKRSIQTIPILRLMRYERRNRNWDCGLMLAGPHRGSGGS